jgi:hypothetical protein
MKVKIVLNGGLSSCCSSYPLEFVREVVKSWLKETDELQVIDKKEGNWTPDELASLAEEYFGDASYPLLYVNDTLAAIGDLPDRDTLTEMTTGQKNFGITQEDILEEAKRHGLLKKD